MKRKVIVGSILTLILIILFVIIYSYFALINIFKRSGMKFSDDINTSIEKGLFIGEFIPIKEYIELDKIKFETQNIWVEKSWVNKGEIVENMYNVVIPFPDISFSDLNISVYVINDITSNISNRTIEYITEKKYFGVIDEYQDTLILLYKLNNVDKDSVEYVRSK